MWETWLNAVKQTSLYALYPYLYPYIFISTRSGYFVALILHHTYLGTEKSRDGSSWLALRCPAAALLVFLGASNLPSLSITACCLVTEDTMQINTFPPQKRNVFGYKINSSCSGLELFSTQLHFKKWKLASQVKKNCRIYSIPPLFFFLQYLLSL